jgi:hypothetical protein
MVLAAAEDNLDSAEMHVTLDNRNAVAEGGRS